MGEGRAGHAFQSFVTDLHQPPNHRLDIFKHKFCWNAGRRNSVLPKKPRSRLIVGDYGRRVVTPSIDFDCQLGFCAEEIEHINSRWMLSSKLVIARSLSQCLPKCDFRRSHLRAKLPGDFDGVSLASDHRAPLHHLRWSPSPEGEDYFRSPVQAWASSARSPMEGGVLAKVMSIVVIGARRLSP